jgi:hypothetical protein
VSKKAIYIKMKPKLGYLKYKEQILEQNIDPKGGRGKKCDWAFAGR